MRPGRSPIAAHRPLDGLAMLIADGLGAAALAGCGLAVADDVCWVLLASISHLPPSAVPLVSDVRFCWSA